jgi:transmembrane sensor
MSTDRITYLLEAWSSRKASRAEEDELFNWMTIDGNEEIVKAHITNLLNENQQQQLFPTVDWENIYQQILQKRTAEGADSRESSVVSMKPKQLWKRIAVAASILLFVSFAIYVISTKEKSLPTDDSRITTHDIPAPDKNRAQIKLSDGTIVYLDSAANGELVNVNGVQVTKTADGQIIYSTPSAVATPTAVSYNTLSNPRGSIVMNMTLSDGSKVWLNAGSSITYPVAFINNERRVTITGEAYFEISHDKSKPFIVSANNKADVTVLGTHFNVNAYDDEQEVKVTLLEGSVKTSMVNGESSILKPGQQAVIARNEAISINNNANLEEALAWKNQQFIFDRLDIESIMRQLSRWYNIDVVYQGKVPADQFSGVISRQRNISAVLAMLKATGDIQFTIDGKKITVTVPK